jgi:cytochrome c5
MGHVRVLWGTAVSMLAVASVSALATRAASHSIEAGVAPAPMAMQSAAAQTASAAADHQTLVQRYCVTCHNERIRTGGLTLQGLDLDAAPSHAETWEKVIRMVRGGMMPPAGMPKPAPEMLDGLVAWLEHTIDLHAFQAPDPGQKPIHRLNRTEYRNAVRDVLDLAIDASEFLPADDESHGFDNIAGVLRVSPSLLEQYLNAARKISALAVGSDTDVMTHAFQVPPDDSQESHVDGLPLGTRGGLIVEHTFPQDAEYDFSVFLQRNIVGYVTGLEFAHELEILIDGDRVFAAPVGGEEDNAASDENMSLAAEMLEARLRSRVHVAAGRRMVGVTFVRRNSAEWDEPLQAHERDHDLQNMNGIPLINYVSITGPYGVTGPGDTPSRQRIFSCRPATRDEESACANQILSSLARRAYRRPVTTTDVEPLLRLYESGRASGTFETGIEHALRLILASPNFLFRTETTPDPGTIVPVTDVELASRLSFFLWSSIPDDELLRVAEEGRLKDPVVLEEQIRRMLGDPKSRALVENFAGQWLKLRNLRSHIPNPGDFPNFTNELRWAFWRETELFFESIMREDRNVLEFLTADYTFVNERLARHYGIPNVYGSHFRRVTLPGEARRGLLGQGSILTVTSYPNRTSPVLRGHFILENILGTPPPPPPPNVPALEENHAGEMPRSLRERLEQHRRNPACAGCHRAMDPPGFALENFDGIGQWRTKEPGGEIDPSGELADGTPFNGPVSLRAAILRRPDMFVQTLTEKLMTYGLGRGVEYADKPFVRAIERQAAQHDYRFSRIIFGIVDSPPFQMKRAHDGSDSSGPVTTVAARQEAGPAPAGPK